MSRVPKYRAWYKPLGVMIHSENLVMINFDTKVLGVYMEMDGKGYHVLRMSDFELLEYTGLKDKNEQEIYEGYILLWEHKGLSVKVKVRFKDGMFLAGDMPLYDCLDEEIIGNIYENPELIEV
ncbi:YopX family protein [Paenibacillus sp. FSL L8-0708]|uniref:YopX family protein n=1 Tax=Paenibacillus sp. FSL L8-0708 TaxID=2975311 RepID=UPI0030F903B4